MARSDAYTEYLKRARRQLDLHSLRCFVSDIFEQANKTPYVFGEHHERIINALEAVVEGRTRKLIINIAPRYGKTELAVKLFISWCFALNPRCRFIHLSYSSSLVSDNSETIKGILKSEYYKMLFPYVAIAPNRDRQQRWETTEGGGMYAVSTLGQITGFGAGTTDSEVAQQLDAFTAEYNPDQFSGAIVIDDPIRPEDALSDNVREAVNRRFETTIRNRVNSRRTPIVIIGQRVHEHDLCGYLQAVEPDEWEVLSIPCVTIKNGVETALWPHKHTLDELHKLYEINSFVFDTQYQQEPKPLEGLMYQSFRTYETLPVGPYTRKNYTDTADTGADYLCSIDYAEFPWGDCYVLNVLYTDRAMEFTEPETARMLDADKISTAIIESNNGGRGFARAVERNLREMGNRTTAVTWFNQSQNKQARIFSHSADVQNSVFFPVGWDTRWPRFHNALTSYRKEGGNLHDDAPDALTGVVEKRNSGGRGKFGRT